MSHRVTQTIDMSPGVTQRKHTAGMIVQVRYLHINNREKRDHVDHIQERKKRT